MQMFSRSGLPFTAKSVTGIDRTDVYKPVISTPEAFDGAQRPRDGAGDRSTCAASCCRCCSREMYARYYAQAAFQAAAAPTRRSSASSCSAAWSERPLRRESSALAARYGTLRSPRRCSSAISRSTRAATTTSGSSIGARRRPSRGRGPDGASPVKSAAEVFRIFRDPMRSVVEQGGLSLDSYLDFNADIRSRIHRLVAGPPALRSRQLLALMDAGIVRMPYGPAPRSGPARRRAAPGDGSHADLAQRRSSSRTRREVDFVIRGHLDEPRIDRLGLAAAHAPL